MTVTELLASPESLLVDGMTLSAQPGLNRDFMLGGPPDGSPLTAGVFLNGSPPGTLPASVTDVYLWAIRDSSAVWDTTLGFWQIDWTRNGAHQYVVGGGPRWDPGILVDVVIGVRTSPHNVSFGLFRNVLITESL
jgi:hypothetical protein